MANKTIKTKYGTVINVQDLTPEEIAKVKNAAEAGGSYGGKGAALADAMRKEKAKKASAPKRADGATTQQTQGGATLQQAPANLRGKARDDWYKARGQKDARTFLAGNQNPVQANPVGTSPITETDPASRGDAGLNVGDAQDPNQTSGNQGAVDEDKVLAGLPQVFGAQDLLAEKQKALDANYAYLSRDFGKNKATEIENKKQELANRGIPYSDDPNSPYGKAIREIDTRYSDLDVQARNQAIAGGNETLNTLSGISIGANQAAMKNFLGLTEAELSKYGIDQDTMTKLKNIAAQKEIAAKRNSGGGGDNGSNVVIGGDAP
jgi:hypothetical protein